MSWKNADRWGHVSQALHWLVVLLIAAIAIIGLTMGELPNGVQKIRLYALHKSLGLTLLALVALRIAWRLAAGAPPPVAGTPRWQAAIASVTHWALYALMFAMPITGWVLNSAAGYPLQWFGLFNLPKIVATDPALHEQAEWLHENGFWLLLALVVVHAAAAFYHHLFLEDDTLRRMLPARRRAAVAPSSASPAQETPDAP
ncbi:cytochrome b [Tolypothrix campylonemoides VB511288]|nr:cytochrome b [Tolypothrix campylonemoides VB511288]